MPPPSRGITMKRRFICATISGSAAQPVFISRILRQGDPSWALASWRPNQFVMLKTDSPRNPGESRVSQDWAQMTGMIMGVGISGLVTAIVVVLLVALLVKNLFFS
jgi:hypothetical protein